VLGFKGKKKICYFCSNKIKQFGIDEIFKRIKIFFEINGRWSDTFINSDRVKNI